MAHGLYPEPGTLSPNPEPERAQVFEFRHLECFYEDEIERLLCGEGETWCALSPRNRCSRRCPVPSRCTALLQRRRGEGSFVAACPASAELSQVQCSA